MTLTSKKMAVCNNSKKISIGTRKLKGGKNRFNYRPRVELKL